MLWFASKEKTREKIDQWMEQARHERDKQNILTAIELLEKCIHLDKDYATPYGEYGIVLAQQGNNFERAEYNGFTAIIKDSQNPIQWRNMAHTYYLLGRYPKAYISILVAESINRNYPNVQRLKSLIHGIMAKDHSKEMESLEDKTKLVFFKYSHKPVIMPEPFFEEVLVG